MEWKGRVAVVTGASTGIGRATALELGRRGATVIGVARSRDRLGALAEELRGAGASSETAPLDVGDAMAVTATLRDVERRYGRIDLLVNNAGTGVYGSVARISADAYATTLRTNFLGAVHCTQAVLKGMLERRSGHIINVSSPIAFSPAPGQSAYAASKAALDAFSESLLLEVERRGVRVSIVYPGWVDTPLTRNEFRNQPPAPKSVRMPPERVAAGILHAAETGKLRVYLPWFTGLAPMVRGIAPGFLRRQTARAQPLRE